MKNIFSCAIVTSIGLFSFAQSPDSVGGSLFTMELEELMDARVSIATKTDQPVSETPSSVSVITAEDIKNMGIKQLEDVLQFVPGFETCMTYNSYYTVGIRGVKDSRNASKLLVMIDGIPINMLFHGTAILYGYDMNIDAIERIEIIRGPGSALYGRNALSGVINIITRKFKSDKTFRMKGTYGGFDTYMLSGDFGLKKKTFTAYVAIRGVSTQHSHEIFNDELYRLNRNTFAFNTIINYRKFTFSGIFYLTKDRIFDNWVTHKPGYYSLGYSDNINPKISFDFKIRGHNAYYEEDLELAPPDTASYFPLGLYVKPSSKEFLYGIETDWKFKLQQNQELLMGIQADYHGVYDVIITSNADSLANPLPVPIPGLGRDNQIVYKPGWFENNGHTYRNMAFFVQDVWHPIKILSITAGIRYDFDSQIKNQLNPRLGIVCNPFKSSTVKLLYGRAYRAPGPAEQYATLGFAFGNKDLKPEIINTCEMVFTHRYKGMTNSVSLYWDELKDMIYAPLGIEINPDFKYHNIGRNRSRGIEFENRIVLNEKSYTFFNCSYTESDNTIILNGTDSTYFQPDVAPFKLNAGVNYHFLKFFNANLNLFYRSKMEKFKVYDASTNSFVDAQDNIGNYAICNFTLQVSELIKQFTFSASIYNIFNVHYYEQDNEHLHQPSQPGRQLLITICYAL
jgi:outer membrane receptor for ferrienterochelin and colicins